MRPGEIHEIETGSFNHDLFNMGYDWEEDDIKRFGSQKMVTMICWFTPVEPLTSVTSRETRTSQLDGGRPGELCC